MVSYEATRRKYRGSMARNYEAKRRVQQRWWIENETVERMITDCSTQLSTLLDCPVGTGRFLQLYFEQDLTATGVDASEEMLALAGVKKRLLDKKRKSIGDWRESPLELGDATKLRFEDKSFDCAVCVRFLDLIDAETMRRVVSELTRVTRSMIVLTIRLGETYVPKSNTATHDERKFRALVALRGWRIAEETPVFRAGWRVMRLERRSQR